MGFWKVASALGTVGMFVFTVPVLAQEAAVESGAAGATADEIIVTAQKRAQSINSVGMSITAVGGSELADLGVTKTQDLVKVVPSLNYTPTSDGPPVYTLRGVGFYESSLSASPAVSVYLDEAPLAFPFMAQVGQRDLERVEVLKGPQGTLYGENSTGGAINYIVAKPTDSFQAGARVSAGRFYTFDGEAFVSGPISDTLKARLSMWGTTSGNWQKSYTRDDSRGAARQIGGRLLTEWNPTDRFKLSLNLNFWRDRSDTLAYQLALVRIDNPAGGFDFLQPGYPLAPNTPRSADWSPDFPTNNRDSFRQGILRGEYELTDGITLTSITGVQKARMNKYVDMDATQFQTQDIRRHGSIKSFNQELRLSGDTDKLHWVLGGYLSDATIQDWSHTFARYLSVTVVFPDVPRFNESAVRTKQKAKNYAGFFNAEYNITDAITLVGGARYTQSNRYFRGCNYNVDGLVGLNFEALQRALRGDFTPIPLNGCFTLSPTFEPAEVTGSLKENNLSWHAGLNWKSAAGALLYASASRGYKGGSFPLVSAADSSQFSPVTQEKVTAYEIGAKLPLLDRRLQLNAAGYYYDYINKQTRGRVRDRVFGQLERLVNIPKSRIWGVEAEAVARPVDGLRLSLAGNYTNTKVKEFVTINTLGVDTDFAGTRLPFTPEWSSVGDIEYTAPINDNLDGFIGGAYTYRSSTKSTFDELPFYKIPAYTLFDARFGIANDAQKWKATAWIRNLTNKYHYDSIFFFIDTGFKQPGRPRTFGLTFEIGY